MNMTNMQLGRIAMVLFGVLFLLLAVSLLAVGGALADDIDANESEADDEYDEDVPSHVTDIGTSHPLATDRAVDAFDSDDYATGDLSRYRISLTAATDGEDVGLEASLTRDTRNDYVRIDYNESSTRTLRILLPRQYITPYTQDGVESFVSDHEATYEPVRGGDYLAITVEFDGQGAAVLPLEKDSSASYSLVERVDRRVEQITGISPLGRDGQWQYIDGEEVANRSTYPINASADSDVLVQYDARPDSAEEVWINAPHRETSQDDVYVFERTRDGELFLVSDGDHEPDIRMKTNATRADELRGDANEVRLVPDRIRDGFGGGIPFFGG